MRITSLQIQIILTEMINASTCGLGGHFHNMIAFVACKLYGMGCSVYVKDKYVGLIEVE